jgi:hypothetical protein
MRKESKINEWISGGTDLSLTCDQTAGFLNKTWLAGSD